MKPIIKIILTQTFSISSFVKISGGEIKLNNDIIYSSNIDSLDLIQGAYKHLAISYPKFYKMDLMSKTGFLVSELLLKSTISDIDAYKKGILLQNFSSSLMTDKNYQETLKTIPSPALFVYTLPNIVMGEIAIRHGFKGENTFFVADKMNAKQLVDYASILLNENVLEQLIVGYLEINEMQQDVLMCLVEKNTNTNMPFNEMELNKIYTNK